MLDLYRIIKQRREALGMSQDELAKKTGYTSRSSITKIEKGLVDLPQSKIVDFSKALDTTPGELMGWDQGLLQIQKEKRKNYSEKWNIQYLENQMLESFSELSDKNKKKTIDYTQTLLSIQKMDSEQTDILKAAHNDDNSEEQQRLMQEDLEEL